MRKTNFLMIVLATAMTLSAISCEKEAQPAQNDSLEPVSWTLNQSEITVLTGEAVKVYGTVAWSNGETNSDIEAANLNAGEDACVWTYGGWKMVGMTPGTATVKANVRMGGSGWTGYKEFYQDVKVNVVYPEETITGLEISPAYATIKSGQKIDFKVYAVYGDAKREIAPVCCSFDVTDDGGQHISYLFKGNEAYVNASQDMGETYIKVTYTENGKTVEANSTIESI
jgi:hypothetical protein